MSKSLYEQHPPLAQEPTFLQNDEFAAAPWIAWWYKLMTPQPPLGRIATLRERENIRRSRLASILLAVQLFAIELPVIPIVANAPGGHIALPWLIGCVLALPAAFFFNKRGNLTVAGLLMVASIEISIFVKLLTFPGGLNVAYLPQFDILIQSILISVALLAPWSAFAVAALNISFIIFILTVPPHAPDLVAVLNNPHQVSDVFAVPIMGQILAAFFGWIIVKNLLVALKRASQAEQIAALEHHIAQSRAETEVRNQQLEAGIRAIVYTIQMVSNQQVRERIQVPSTNELWPVAQQLNKFLDRYQGAREAEAEVESTRQLCNAWANEIHQARQENRSWRIPTSQSQTPLEVVFAALVGARSQAGNLRKSASGNLFSGRPVSSGQ